MNARYYVLHNQQLGNSRARHPNQLLWLKYIRFSCSGQFPFDSVYLHAQVRATSIPSLLLAELSYYPILMLGRQIHYRKFFFFVGMRDVLLTEK